MRSKSIFLSVILVCCASLLIAQGTWTQMANFGGTARHSAVGFTIGEKGYIGTGTTNWCDGPLYNDFWEFDPATNVWTQKADFGGSARAWAVGFSIGNFGYIGTGQVACGNATKDFWQYDPIANTWIRKADIGGIGGRYSAVGFSIGNKGYVGTGDIINYSHQKDFWEYDPATDAWTQKADLGGSVRQYAAAFTANGKGYVGTGYNGSRLNDFWEYNPSTNSWTQKANFSGGSRLGAVGFSVGNIGFIGTGEGNSYDYNDLYSYDPALNSWKQEASFNGPVRDRAVGFSIGDNGFIGTGESWAGSSKFNDFWEYTPEGSTAPNPIPFINQPLVPDVIVPGGAGFTLTVNGTGFVSGAVVNWNGDARSTTFLNSSQLTANILASDIISAGTATITVFNPSPGGGISNVVFFSITNPIGIPVMVRSEYEVGMTPIDPIAVDFNLDGKLDIAIANHVGASTVSILLGNGDGTFQPLVAYQVGTWPVGPASGDFNGDGKPDLAVGNYIDNNLSVLIGNGDGTFQPQVRYATGSSPGVIVTADFNGDGKLDLVTHNCKCFNPGESTVSVLLGNGDGTFKTQIQYDAGHTPTALIIGDFNNDNKLDLVVANYYVASVNVLFGNGDGSFQLPVAFSTGPIPYGLEVADFNADGNLDFVVSSESANQVSLFLGNGDGTFQIPQSYSVGPNPNSGDIGDLDADGNLDLVISSQGSDSVSFLFGNGDGTFASQIKYYAGGVTRSLVVGDFNGDGLQDVVAGNNNDSKISMLLQIGESTCVTPTKLTAAKITSTTAKLDWDDVSGAAGYGIRYKVIGDKSWTLKTSTQSAKKIEGLQQGTEYIWSVRTYCSFTPPAVTSAWSPNQTFTTGTLRLEAPVSNSLEVYPNPFQQSATIAYSIVSVASVQIALYDLSGKLMKMLVNENASSGMHTLSLSSKGLSQGIYLLKFQFNDGLMVKKVVIE